MNAVCATQTVDIRSAPAAASDGVKRSRYMAAKIELAAVPITLHYVPLK
jgi:hypothetical protein